ncbi:hypothetical protein CHU98_g4471 [Xylaria longipes]|nr:hypothetical protein CHU98_g4471 [Xylaria longipes]
MFATQPFALSLMARHSHTYLMGKRLRRVEEEGKRVTVHFEDGTSASGDILVGADGVNSVGRPNSELLNSVQLSNIWGQERQLSLAHSTYAYASQELGYVILVGLNKVNNDLSADYYWCVGWEDHDVGKSDHWLKYASGAAKHDRVMKMTESLEPKFREIFELTPVTCILPGQTIYRDLVIPSQPAGRIVLFEEKAECKPLKMRSVYPKH